MKTSADNVELMIEGYVNGLTRFPISHLIFWMTKTGTDIRKDLKKLDKSVSDFCNTHLVLLFFIAYPELFY